MLSPGHTPAHRPLKRLGQNFLVDSTVANDIVSSSRLTVEDVVLEPGAGKGFLTRMLLKSAGRVIAVEKDPLLASELKNHLGRCQNLDVIEGDVLRVQLPDFTKIVATPPYYLSSKLILFLSKRKFNLACLVLQREFGLRLSASPGSRNYGRLSVMSHRHFDVEILRNISRSAFQPQPKVESVLVRLVPKKPARNLDENVFEELVRGIFTQRRRLVKSALRHFLELKLGQPGAKLMIIHLHVPEGRVYELTVAELEDLATDLSRALKSLVPP